VNPCGRSGGHEIEWSRTLPGAAKFIASLRDRSTSGRAVDERYGISDPGVVSAATIAFTVVCLFDGALDGDSALLGAACAGCGAGAALGLLLCVARHFLALLPPTVAWAGWVVTGCLFVANCFSELQLLARLRSQYAALAVVAAAVSVVAGSLIVVGGIRSPLSTRAQRQLPVPTTRQFLLRAALLIGVAGTSLRLDGFLPAANVGFAVVLHWTAMACAVYGVLYWCPWRGRRAWTHRATVPLFGALLLPFFVLHPDRLDRSALLQHRASLRSIQLLRALTDFDRDGYSSWLGDGDCAGWSVSIGPGVDEVPGNGVDDNCQLGDAPVPTPTTAAPASPAVPGQAPPSIVLVTVDTLSADHMSLHGYERATTPNIASWAERQGIVFDNAFSPGTSTVIALSSLFRGVYPRRLDWSPRIKSTSNRLVTHSDQLNRAAGERAFRTFLVPAVDHHPTLPGLLRVRGYRTVSLTAVEPPSLFTSQLNIAGTFDEQIALPAANGPVDDREVTRLALGSLDSLTARLPFFFWIHYYGPHTPTARHTNVPAFGATAVDDYDHEIAALDAAIAPLLVALERLQDSGENVMVLLTSDHGEDCAEGRRTHADSIARSVLHVPLIVSSPHHGLSAMRVARTVSTLDVFATVLEAVGTPVPRGVDSKPLLSDRDPTSDGQAILSEGWLYDARGSRIVENIVALRDKCQLARDNLTRAWRATGSCGAGALAALQHEVKRYTEVRTTIHSH
jgi:arylsulfatase A-like enzyme